MKKLLAGSIALCLCVPAVAYDLKNLSVADLLTIGRGLDKLPREDTDREHGDLYNRIQAQITAQEQQAATIAAQALRDKITAEIRAKESGEQKHE